MKMLIHLSALARHQELVDFEGNSYLGKLTPLKLPITFIHGEQAQVWLPETSSRTYDELVRNFGQTLYQHHVFPQHGHQDVMMGTTAWRTSFPVILDHLERWVAPTSPPSTPATSEAQSPR